MFTTEADKLLRNNNFRRGAWGPARKELGFPKVPDPPPPPHLRDAANRPRGRMRKAIQATLGHSSTQITFDTYDHLLPDEQDGVAEALDETFRSAIKKR